MVLLMVAMVANASAAGATTTDTLDDGRVPVVFDALFMRPIGFSLTCAGFVTWLLYTPLMAMTRPTDMNKPFNTLVIQPARFTFVDPLGFHPDRREVSAEGRVR